MTKQQLAIHVLGWISRQDDPDANLSARVLLVLSMSIMPCSPAAIAKALGISPAEVLPPLQLLRDQRLVIPNSTELTVRGVNQVRKIINSK